MKKLKALSRIKDKRGEIRDLIEEENINSVTLVTFKKGAVRGNHFHKRTTQWNFVMEGSVALVTKLPGKPQKRTILKKGDLAVTVPKEFHTIVGIEDFSQLVVFTKGPRSASQYESDTFRLEKPLVKP